MVKESRKEIKTCKIKDSISKFVFIENDDDEPVRKHENKRARSTALQEKKPSLKRPRVTASRKGKCGLKNQPKQTEVYGKEDWECYRANFQKSYEKSSQLYYDALESPSKIANLYGTSSSSDNEVYLENNELIDSSGDEIMPPSQHDFEIIKLKKSKRLLDEMYHKDLDSKLKLKNDEPEELRSSSIVPLTLSQLCAQKVEIKQNTPTDLSFITFSDDDSVLVENIKSPEPLKLDTDELSMKPINNESDSDCIILPDSQSNSPMKPSGENIVQCSQDSNLLRTNAFELEENHAYQLQEAGSFYPHENQTTDALVLNDSQNNSFISSIPSEDMPKTQKKKKNPKAAKPKASELNCKLKQMGIKLSNQDLVSKFKKSPELQQLIVSPLANDEDCSDKNTSNPIDLKLNLIYALNYESHIEVLDKLTSLIQNFKNDQEKMSLLLEKPAMKGFFLNISTGKPWKFIEFKESLLSFVRNLIALNGDLSKENDNVVPILQLLDHDILREWSEDELGACFQMLR